MNFIIVGLGNPGKKYENTRHNAGFMVLDKLADKLNVKINKLKFKSLCCEAEIEDKKVLLLKPDTFMNLSGEAVVQAMNFYKVNAQNIIIVLDDITLDVGKMRIRRKGSDGGQNGMKNIIYLSGSDEFPRIKIGIGNKPHPQFNLADWVLSSFTDEENKILSTVCENSCDAICKIVAGNTDKAMNLYNS